MPDSLQALSALGVMLKRRETGAFRGIRFIGANESVEAEFPNGLGLGIRRTLLHQALIDHATELGADLLWSARVDARRGGVKINGEPVRYRHLVGADGNESRIRKFAHLDIGGAHQRRIGLRRHFKIAPWSDFVEIYWGQSAQAYVTPIAADQVCVAIIARHKVKSFDVALSQFPRLVEHLRGQEVITTVKGAVTVSRQLPAVTSGRVALIGEASGSADAITGAGLAMCFRQAVVLGQALASEDLSFYEREHRKIMMLPQFMGRAMLLMDRSPWAKTRSLRALSAKPHIFQRMLSVHVGAAPLVEFGISNAVNFGWQLLTA